MANKKIFDADLELERINKFTVRYLVKNANGLKVQNLSTLEISRSDFPKDDNFSLHFMEEDIAAMAKTGDRDAPEGVASLLQKQAQFRQFKKFKLYIVTVE